MATATLQRWLTGINQMHAAAGGGPVPGRSVGPRTLSGVSKTRR